ncbi:HAD hydrolase family protein [Lactobacillaceae bacterium Melli_B4]
MTKLILADLNLGFITDDGQIDTARLNQQLNQLNQQQKQLGFLTELPYSKLLQLFQNVSTSLAFICESGAETVYQHVVRDEQVIDYDIWHQALQWIQTERDFNTAYVVLSGKMNAYTDAAADSDAYRQFQTTYPSLYPVNHLDSVGDLIYQMRLDFNDDDLENRAQTFNNHFNGKLIAHAVDNHLYITAYEASYPNAIAGLAAELDIDEHQDVEVVSRADQQNPIDQLVADDMADNGYDVIDELINK